MSKPKNLFVQEEPDYQVRIIHPDMSQTILNRNGRRVWKRLSAISHARYFAIKNPSCVVHVEVVGKRALIGKKSIPSIVPVDGLRYYSFTVA